MRKIDQDLIDAVYSGSLDEVKHLVSVGANVKAGNNRAIRFAAAFGELEIMKFLISVGADITADNNYPVRWAADKGHLEVVKHLVSLGADVTADDDATINWAVWCGNWEIVKVLISAGATYEEEEIRKAIGGFLGTETIPESREELAIAINMALVNRE